MTVARHWRKGRVDSDLLAGTYHVTGSGERSVHHGGVESLRQNEVCVLFPLGM